MTIRRKDFGTLDLKLREMTLKQRFLTAFRLIFSRENEFAINQIVTKYSVIVVVRL